MYKKEVNIDMSGLSNLAKYIRSKNAGPFWTTIDIFCKNRDSYNKVKNSNNLNELVISKIYNVNESEVSFFYMDNLNVVKISFPRRPPQGHKFEKDMHSGQQYNQILNIT